MKKRNHCLLIVACTIIFLFFVNAFHPSYSTVADAQAGRAAALAWRNSMALLEGMRYLALVFSVYLASIVLIMTHALFWGEMNVKSGIPNRQSG
jgi:hypothetical protein